MNMKKRIFFKSTSQLADIYILEHTSLRYASMYIEVIEFECVLHEIKFVDSCKKIKRKYSLLCLAALS